MHDWGRKQGGLLDTSIAATLLELLAADVFFVVLQLTQHLTLAIFHTGFVRLHRVTLQCKTTFCLGWWCVLPSCRFP